MHLTGHRTREVFKRYAIVDEGMLSEAGEKLAAMAATVQSSKDRAAGGKVIALRG